MVIIALKISHFGKFEDRTVSLRPGMNIINGDNESGKSTIAAFIKAMLYGMETGSREYKRNKPYDYTGIYGGSMQVLSGGGFYEITRDFAEGDESLVITKIGSEQVIENPERWLQEALSKVTRVEYEESGFVSQNVLLSDLVRWSSAHKTSEEVRAEAMAAHYDRAADHLMKIRDSYAESIDPALEKDAEMLAAELAETESALSDARKSEHEVRSLWKEKDVRLRQELELIERRNAAKAAAFQKRETDAEESLQAVSLKLKKEEKKKPVAGTVIFTLGLIAAAAAAFLFASYDFDFYSVPGGMPLYELLGAAGMGALCILVGLVLLIVCTAVNRKRVKKLTAEIRGLETELADAKESNEDYLLHREEVEERLSDREERETEVVLIKDKAEEMKTILSGLEDKRELLTEELADKRSRMEKQEVAAREIEAIDEALASFKRMKENVLPEKDRTWIEYANAYYSAMGTPEGAKIELDSDNRLVLSRNGKKLDLTDLSERASKEILLAVRLAYLKVYDPKNELPLILDDVFASSDGARLSEALTVLRKESRQVVLLSCHKRELQNMK